MTQQFLNSRLGLLSVFSITFFLVTLLAVDVTRADWGTGQVAPSTPATLEMNRAAAEFARQNRLEFERQKQIQQGNDRAALCGRPGVACDDDGNTTYTYDDGSTMTEHADGTRTSTEASAGAGAGAGAGGSASAGGETQQCLSLKETASSACLTPGTSGMDPGEAAMFTVMANQMVTLGTQIASAGRNMAQQCRLQADMSKLMATLNGVKATACGVMISKCKSACDTETEQYEYYAKQYESNPNTAAAAEQYRAAARKTRIAARTCGSYSTQVYAMGMGAMQHGANIVQNQQCAREAEAFANMPVPTFSPIAMPNPTDCTDPNNQSFACFCTREVNKSSPMCAGFNGGNLAGGGASPTGPSNGIGSNVATPFLGTDMDGDGIEDDPAALQPKQNASNGDGFSPGGGSAPGGGGLGGFGGDDGGMGAPGDPRSAITGTSGGTGSGLGGGGGGGGGLARNNRGAGGGGGLMDKFNLKRFLPGSKYKARGLAGMSVKSVDGITGPMGPSIWEKATRQYQEQIQKKNVIVDR